MTTHLEILKKWVKENISIYDYQVLDWIESNYQVTDKSITVENLHLTRKNNGYPPSYLYHGMNSEGLKAETLKWLPADVFVKGIAYFEGLHNLLEIPERFIVEGEFLQIIDCQKISNIDHVSYKHKLFLEMLPLLKKLPDSLKTSGTISIDNCKSFAEMPDHLSIWGDFELTDLPSLTQLSKMLFVSKDLLITRCNQLTAIERGVFVGNNIEITNCEKLESLPSPLSLDGSLILDNCPALKKLPDGLKAETVYLRKCPQITDLPGTHFLKKVRIDGFTKENKEFVDKCIAQHVNVCA